METINYLGSIDESLRQQCGRMQSVSCFLKESRSQSHPERHIGASVQLELQCCSHNLVTDTVLERIRSRLHLLQILASSQETANYFKFFYLSLLLDTLKATRTLDESKNSNKTSTQGLNYQSMCFLVVSYLAHTPTAAVSPWLGSHSCCLKVLSHHFFIAKIISPAVM